MENGSSVRVLYVHDEEGTAAPRVKERLSEGGFVVRVVEKDTMGAALRDRDSYDVLCIDGAHIDSGLIRELRRLAEGSGIPPTVLIVEPGSPATASFADEETVWPVVRDADGRYLDMVPHLIKLLHLLEIMGREKQEIEGALGKAEERLLGAQKMEAIGMLAGGIAHDFNNALATILGYASFLRDKTTTDDIFSQGLSAIEDSAVRASDLTALLLAYSRAGKGETSAISINRSVRDIHKLIRKTIDKSIDIRLDVSEDLRMIDGDASRMNQVVLNLILNARNAMPQGGVLTIKTFMCRVPDELVKTGDDLPPGDYVGISISDTGTGMDRDVRRLMSDPHASRGEDMWERVGPGLSVVYDVVKGYGGWIGIEGGSGEGTEFTVLLPESAGREERPPEVSEAVKGGSETILVIDDETQIVQMLERLLTDFGYRVLSADSGTDGIRMFREEGDAIDLVVLDIMMPGMNGREVMSRLLTLCPDVKVLLVSGYSEQARHNDLMAMGAAGFIGKPFNMKRLLEKIREILG